MPDSTSLFNSQSESIVLETPQGKLLGKRNTHNNVSVFKGIPYGVPPVGERRWKPCEPAAGWKGLRLATVFAPECVQLAPSEKSFYYRPLPQMSEDCLYLNVWTSAHLKEISDELLPVMVWIHGGSLVDGAGSRPEYDGTELARKDIVLVTINYRLNIFGYFCHPQLTAESIHDASGNYGTTDQVQALKWVKNNIASFGGDPDNVTIFGESSGALSVSHLLVSPLATGLFHRAIMQSVYLPPLPMLKTAEKAGLKFCEYIDDNSDQLTQTSITKMRKFSASELLRLASEGSFYSGAHNTEAVVDNWVFPGQISELFETGRVQDVPILVGFNSGDAYHFGNIEGLTAPVPANADCYMKDIKARYGNLTDEYLAVYPPENLKEVVFAPIRDSFYGWAAERFAQMSERLKSNAYLYYFDHAYSWAEQASMGAFHGAELFYSFNNIKYYNEIRLPNWPECTLTESDLIMAETMSDYWVAFAKNGVPCVETHPAWKPYKDKSRHYMTFKNGTANPGENLLSGAFELHEKINMKRRQQGDLSLGLTGIGLMAPILPANKD